MNLELIANNSKRCEKALKDISSYKKYILQKQAQKLIYKSTYLPTFNFDYEISILFYSYNDSMSALAKKKSDKEVQT